MKTNFFLCSILILLLTFVYYYQERGDIHKERSRNEKDFIFSEEYSGPLRSVHFDLFSIDLDERRVLGKGGIVSLDEESIDYLLQSISKLKILKFVNGDDIAIAKISSFVKDDSPCLTLYFDKENIEVCIGEKIKFDQSFYIKLTKKNQPPQIAIAKDTGTLNSAYEKSMERTIDLYYKKFVGLFSLSEDVFYNRTILRTEQEVSKINFRGGRNADFLVDLVEERTIPELYQGLQYKKNIFKKLALSFRQMKAKRFFPNEKVSDQRKIQDIDFILANNEKIHWSVFETKQSEILILASNVDGLFELMDDQRSTIFANYQDFWPKNALGNLPGQFFVELADEKEQIRIKVKNQKVFQLEVEGNKKVVAKKLKDWLIFFSKEAQYISKLDSKEKKFGKGLSVAIDGSNFQIFEQNKEHILVDLDKNIKYHYNGDVEFPVKNWKLTNFR